MDETRFVMDGHMDRQTDGQMLHLNMPLEVPSGA